MGKGLRLAAEGQMREHAEGGEQMHAARCKLRRGRCAEARGQLEHQIAAAFKRHAHAGPFVVPGEYAALYGGAAHGAHDIVRAAFGTGARKMQRMAPVEGIVFTYDAADLHNLLLNMDRMAEKSLFKTSKMRYNHFVSMCLDAFLWCISYYSMQI